MGIDDVRVDVGGETKAVTQAGASGFIEIGDELGEAQEAESSVKSHGTGGGVLSVGMEAVGTRVGRMEGRVQVVPVVRWVWEQDVGSEVGGGGDWRSLHHHTPLKVDPSDEGRHGEKQKSRSAEWAA